MEKKNMNSEWEIMFGKQKPKEKNKESIELKQLITENNNGSLLTPIEKEEMLSKEQEINSDKVIIELKNKQYDMLNNIEEAKEVKRVTKKENQFCLIY